jgi:hypothetical protein
MSQAVIVIVIVAIVIVRPPSVRPACRRAAR